MEKKRYKAYIAIFVVTTIIASCIAVYFGIIGDKNKKELQEIEKELAARIEKTSYDTINKEKNEVTLSSINKRLYRLFSEQRYVLLIDDNTYDSKQDFLKRKTYILDLNMINGNDIVKEIDLSSKLEPFVNEYISMKKGSLNGICTVEYFEVEDVNSMTFDKEKEVVFEVYYRCVNGNLETSLGNEIYAYNVETGIIRDLGEAH